MYPVGSGFSRKGSQMPVPDNGPSTNVPPGQYFALSAAEIETNAFDVSSYRWLPNTLKQRNGALSGGGVGLPEISTDGATCVAVLPTIGTWTVIGFAGFQPWK